MSTRRRVVTGHDANGKAVFASDEQVEGIAPLLNPASEFHRLWGGDTTPRFPDDGAVQWRGDCPAAKSDEKQE